MTNRATFTLDTEAYDFLHNTAGSNKSAFINNFLKAEKTRQLAEAIKKANIEEAQDYDSQQILSEWDTTMSNGLP